MNFIQYFLMPFVIGVSVGQLGPNFYLTYRDHKQRLKALKQEKEMLEGFRKIIMDHQGEILKSHLRSVGVDPESLKEEVLN